MLETYLQAFILLTKRINYYKNKKWWETKHLIHSKKYDNEFINIMGFKSLNPHYIF